MGFEKRGDVCQDLRGRACKTSFGRFLNGAAPAALVEGVDLYGAGGETVEKGAVGGIAVVTETVDKD